MEDVVMKDVSMSSTPMGSPISNMPFSNMPSPATTTTTTDTPSDAPPKYDRYKNAILAVIKTFPQDESAWTSRGPRNEADVGALFRSLTMDHVAPRLRKRLPCRFLLESLARSVAEQQQPGPPCPLHGLTLAAAASVALEDGQITEHEAAEVLAYVVFPRTDRADLGVRRAGVARHLRFLDIVRQVTGCTRVYEIPLRSKSCLDKFNGFNHRHLELLEDMLRTGEATIFSPSRDLDSTSLRVQNLVFHLFAGRFNRHRIEMHLLKRDSDGDPADTRPVMGRRPESLPARVLSPSLYKLLPLRRRTEELRRAACTDVVGLAATFRREAHLAALYPMGPWPQLCGFVRRQESSIRRILEGARKHVVDINGHDDFPPRVIRVSRSIGYLVPEGFVGFCVLLRESPVAVKFGDNEVVWEPGHVLCFCGEPPEFVREERPFFFLMSFLEVEPF